MSFDPNDPNKPKNQPNTVAQQQQVVKPVIAPPPVVQGAPGTSQQLRANQAVGQRKGSGFTGIGQIMQANVGQRLGQQVLGQLGQAGQRVQQKTGEAAQKFQTQLGQAQQQYGTAVNTAGTTAQDVIAGQPIQQVQQPTGAIAPQFDPATLAAYQTAVAGEYEGPTGLEDYSDLEKEAELVKLMGEAGQTTGGRMALLQRTYGRGEKQYTAGQAALDALLLGKNAKELAAARRESAGVLEDVMSEQEVAESKARQAGADIAAQAQGLSQRVGATEAQELARLEAQKVDYEKKLSDLSKKVQSEMSSGELSKDTLNTIKSLGIDENTQFYGMPPEDIAKLISTMSPSDISAASTATEEQVRRLNALKRLKGEEDIFSQADVERAGTTRDPAAAFRFGGDLGTTLQKQKQSFEGLFGGIVSDQEKANLQKLKDNEARLQSELDNLKYVRGMTQDQKQKRYGEIQRELTGLRRSAGPFYGEGYGGSGVNRDLMNRFLGGELYDKATGKLNIDFAKQLEKMISQRQVYKGRKGFHGTGGRVFGKDEADTARIKALKQILERYGSGSTFKAKKE
jgi:cell division protein FtsB